jgi:hypothetical protein
MLYPPAPATECVSDPIHYRTPRSLDPDVCDDFAMDRLDDSTIVALPIACTLGADDGAARMQRWGALSAAGHPCARRSGHLLEVRYDPELGVRDELEALAAAEQVCCSFVTWEVSQDGDQIVLWVKADPSRPDDVAPIAALFEAD